MVGSEIKAPCRRTKVEPGSSSTTPRCYVIQQWTAQAKCTFLIDYFVTWIGYLFRYPVINLPELWNRESFGSGCAGLFDYFGIWWLSNTSLLFKLDLVTRLTSSFQNMPTLTQTQCCSGSEHAVTVETVGGFCAHLAVLFWVRTDWVAGLGLPAGWCVHDIQCNHLSWDIDWDDCMVNEDWRTK